VHRGRGDGPVGPDRQCPFPMTDTAPVERQVHDELERGRAVKRPRGPTHGDRTEDRDFDAVVRHAGERSAARRVGAGGFPFRNSEMLSDPRKGSR